jgi:hypothetical protein
MFACVGFASVFQQAGLISEDSSLFSAISTVSGASWFSTQLFYSPDFFAKTVLASPDELYDFVISWMDTYLAISENVTNYEVCDTTDLGDVDKLAIFRDLCNVLVYYEGDWAAFVSDMLAAASTGYGDVDFVNQLAGVGNRHPALQQTDLLIQSALVPVSRVRSSDTAVYLGPSDSATSDTLYSVPLSAAYVVRSSDSTTSYQYSSESNLISYTAPTPPEYSPTDWEDFYLYPETNGTVEIDNTFNATVIGAFREPFGGSNFTTVIQAASISSAAIGSYSPLVPSAFSQSFSEQRDTIESTGSDLLLSAFDRRVSEIYQNPVFDNAAVCSQWPKSCGESDGFFIDGWFVDNPALAINIGQYHALQDADLDKTIKVVLTNTNEEWNTTFQYTQFLQYFNASFNQNVAPGGFLWAPSYSTPYRSPQIFEDYMDEDSLNALLEPVPGSNMTTAILTATTTANVAFGVLAGQSVEVLLINLNEDITTYIVGAAAIESFTVPLAEMTRDIASNEHILSRVQDFFATSLAADTASPSVADTSSPSVAGTTSPTMAPTETSSADSYKGVHIQSSLAAAVILMMILF